MAIQAQPIEKKSLDAHVDLCAERYKELHTTITSMNLRIFKRRFTPDYS